MRAKRLKKSVGRLLGAQVKEPRTSLNLRPLGESERILYIDTQISNSAFNLGVTQQNLNGAQVASLLVNDGRFGIPIPIGPRAQRFVAAASPAYLARYGIPRHPHDLLNHACIRHRFASGVIAAPWEFKRNGEVIRIVPDGPLIGSVTELEVTAALADLGVITTFEEFLKPHLASGALVPVLSEWCQEFSGPYLYYPSRRHMPAPLRAFVDFLKSASRET